MSYTNVINMLDLAGIPLMRQGEGQGHPFVIAGGPCAYNAEALADFWILWSWVREEVINQLLDEYAEWKKQGADRQDFWPGSRYKGYIFRFYDVDYNHDGTICSVKPNRPVYLPLFKNG